MNIREINKGSQGVTGSFSQNKPGEGNYFNFNQYKQGYMQKRQNWGKPEYHSQKERFYPPEENIENQKENLPYNNYNQGKAKYQKYSNGNNSYNFSNFNDRKFQYGQQNYNQRHNNYSSVNPNVPFFRNEDKPKNYSVHDKDNQNFPKSSNRNFPMQVYQSHNGIYENKKYYHNQNGANNFTKNLNSFSKENSGYNKNEYKDYSTHSQHFYSNANLQITKESNGDNSNEVINREEGKNEKEQSLKKLRITDKINFSNDIFNEHLNKTTSNLLGSLTCNKEHINSKQEKKQNEENHLNNMNVSSSISNLKYSGMYNKFNIGGNVNLQNTPKNTIPLRASLKGFNNNTGVINNLLNKSKILEGPLKNMQFIPSNIKGQGQEQSQMGNAGLFPKSLIIPNINGVNQVPYMFVPKNIMNGAGGKFMPVNNGQKMSMGGRINNNMTNCGNTLFSNQIKENFINCNFKNSSEMNLINNLTPGVNEENKLKRPKMTNSDKCLQQEHHKSSIDSEDLVDESTRKNTEEAERGISYLSINSEYFDCNYDELNHNDPYSMLNVKIKIGGDLYKKLTLKQSDDIEQAARDFCRDNFLADKFILPLTSVIHKAVDSLNSLFTSDLQSEELDNLNDIYHEFKEEANMTPEIEDNLDLTSLSHWSCLTVLDNTDDSLADFSATNLNITM